VAVAGRYGLDTDSVALPSAGMRVDNAEAGLVVPDVVLAGFDFVANLSRKRSILVVLEEPKFATHQEHVRTMHNPPL
jgi:hypothetical protein